MRNRTVSRFFALTLIAALGMSLTACTSAPTVTPVYQDEAFANHKFYNILVVGVAADYTNRAQFERTLASSLRSQRIYATAYHTVTPGNDAISREAIVRAVDTNGFDAVLVTRILDQDQRVEIGQGTSTAKASTIGGGPLNLFRYDYQELNEPGSIDLDLTARLSTELFAAEEGTMVWGIQLEADGADNVGVLIDDVSNQVVNAVSRAGYLGR
ncbi:MAG: hypothetical protein AAGA61_06910 [Pseudomonadota bacterium]